MLTVQVFYDSSIHASPFLTQGFKRTVVTELIAFFESDILGSSFSRDKINIIFTPFGSEDHLSVQLILRISVLNKSISQHNNVCAITERLVSMAKQLSDLIENIWAFESVLIEITLSAGCVTISRNTGKSD